MPQTSQVVMAIAFALPCFAMASRLTDAQGAWIGEPHPAIGAATVHFLALGLIELTVMTWIDPRTASLR
jgi:hypothetical protein